MINARFKRDFFFFYYVRASHSPLVYTATMKNLRHKSIFFQYTAIAIAPPAIGNKGFVVSNTKIFPLPSTELHVCDRFSELKRLQKIMMS